MRIVVNSITIKLFAWLVIGIMAMFIANKAVYIHAHKLYDGSIIEHAHPYNKSADSKPYKSHNHTKIELLVAQSLDILFLFVFLTYALLVLVRIVNFTFRLQTKYSLSCIILHKGRAPPIS